jgi:glycosyltransferase involved in cell wall biosynthesis/FMN phosphatase YigB (HAD superfamily)
MASVLGQSFEDWEHIVVNDGGDAVGLESVAALHKDRYQGRLKLIHHPASVGMQNASNAGIRIATGEFIAIHDDDDAWAAGFLHHAVACLDAHGPESAVQGVVTQTIQVLEEIDSNGNPREIRRHDYCPLTHVSLVNLAAGNLFAPIAFLYRRRAHDIVGLFDQQFDALGDWDFNLRFLSHYEIDVMPFRLALYYWRHQALGSQYGNTVTDRVDQDHFQKATFLRNYYLRQDIRSGSQGLGWLLNSAGVLKSAAELRQKMDEQLDHTHDIRSALDRIHHEQAGFFHHILQTTHDLTRLWQVKKWALESVGRLQAIAAGLRSRDPNKNSIEVAKSSERYFDKLKRLANDADVISVDVFDTLLMRMVRNPSDVFWGMEVQARQVTGQDGLDFRTLRVNAEALARQRQQACHQNDEVTHRDIYHCLEELAGLSADQAARLCEIEMTTEAALMYATPGMREWLLEQSAAGRNILYVSDMYLGRDEIARLLQKCGLPRMDVMVSSEEKCSKYQGELFDRLIKERNLNPGRMLHVGDNPVSDIEQPEKRGIKTARWVLDGEDRPFVDQVDSLSGGWTGDLLSSLFTGVARKRCWSMVANRTGDDIWSRMGYEFAGPLYFSYVYWIMRQAMDRGLKQLFFLARDGYPLVQVARWMTMAYGINIDCQYLFASRRLLNLPVVHELDFDGLYFLCSPNPAMRASDFFERINLNAPSAALLARHGIHDPELLLTTPYGGFVDDRARDAIHHLMHARRLEILDQAAKERKRVLEYFADIGLGKESFGMVDLGWQASSARSISKILACQGPVVPFHAFYFGTWDIAQSAIAEGCRLDSFYFHLHKPSFRAGLLAECVELVEMFFAADTPSITGIEKHESSWRTHHGDPELTTVQDAQIVKAREQAFAFVKDTLLLAPAPQSQPEGSGLGYIDTLFDRVLRQPRREEADALGDLSLRNSFGGRGPLRYLARVHDSAGRPLMGPALREAFDHCYWKKGFIARLTSEQRAELRI